MPFSINFLDGPLEYPFDDSSVPAARGVIVLNDFHEEFLASLAIWSKHQYQKQWKQSLVEVLEGGGPAAMITEYFGSSESASHLLWWPLYRQSDNIYVHNNLLFFDQLPQPFDLENAAASIPPRIIQDEDGNLISEWTLPVDDIRSFVAGLRT
jgi:hypothetical protein